MAEEEASAGGEDAKGGGKKKIIMVVVGLLVGAFVAKTMFLKPPPPTQAELDAAAKTSMLEVWTTCAAENEQPFDAKAAEAEIDTIIEQRNSADNESDAENSGETPPEEPAADGSEGQSARAGAGGLGYRAVPPRAAGGGGGAASKLNPIYENDEVTLNLAGGRYVKVQVALQLASQVDVEALSVANYGARAQDMVNNRLSGLAIEQLQDPATVTAVKNQLGYDICRDYDGEVTKIYFTDLVTQ